MLIYAYFEVCLIFKSILEMKRACYLESGTDFSFLNYVRAYNKYFIYSMYNNHLIL
jgi:hypothetical protein